MRYYPEIIVFSTILLVMTLGLYFKEPRNPYKKLQTTLVNKLIKEKGVVYVNTYMCEYFELRHFDCPWDIEHPYVVTRASYSDKDIFLWVQKDSTARIQKISFESIRISRDILKNHHNYEPPPKDVSGSIFVKDSLYPIFFHKDHIIFIDDKGNQIFIEKRHSP